MYPAELERLIQEYQLAATGEDTLILRKLEAIRALCGDCQGEEMIFAGEITGEFCRVIRLLQAKQEKAADVPAVAPPTHTIGWMAGPVERPMPYRHGQELLAAFYDYFKAEHQIPYAEIRDYPFQDEDEKKQKVNSTMLDYVARINTFANKYLCELFTREEIYAADTFDDILFTYQHLELIIARFNTKNDAGDTVKKRLNIRSALRKLNEFKCVEEAKRR